MRLSETLRHAAVTHTEGFFCHPTLSLLGVSVCVAFALRSLFFSVSGWLWHFARDADLSVVVPWIRWAMEERDGAETYGLLGAVALQWLGTSLLLTLLARLAPRWRASAVVALLAVALEIAWRVPPRPPLGERFATLSGTAWFVSASLLVTWFVGWLGRRSRASASTVLAVVLIPVCFVPIAYSSLGDLICLLAPALRIENGVRLSAIYLQYDLLPSLLALAWRAIGGTPVAFSSVVVSATFYGLFLGVYALARRMLRPQLAAPLLVSLVIVRFYAIVGNIAPQVAPLRLDLWALPLGLVLAVGLRHWSVGLMLGGLCFFSCSIGVLYLGAYVLAVAFDFLAVRRASTRALAIPFWRALGDLFMNTSRVWLIVLLSMLAVRLAFGSFGPVAVATYHQLGIGMMRIGRTSFYWWLLALTGAVGYLAYARRAVLPGFSGEASIFAVTLTASSSIYFFGRSHELNLLNTSAPFLFCLFLGLHLAWPIASDPGFLRWFFRATPWLVVTTVAYFYSNLGVIRTTGQFAEVATQSPLLQASSSDAVPSIDCSEIRGAAGDDHVVFFSSRDYWYYEHCNFEPLGYFQPIYLAVRKKPLAADLSDWLRRGYKLVVPRAAGDIVASSLGEFLPDLPALNAVETPNFQVYRSRP